MRYIGTAVNKEIQFNLLCLEVVKERSVMNSDILVSSYCLLRYEIACQTEMAHFRYIHTYTT